jgi:acetolactate synthase-1/2/3 large subunit
MVRRDLAVISVAEAYLALLKARGIDYLFANAGTDFPPLIEALAHAAEVGIAVPEALAIAHEGVAIAMAHGHTLVSGRPQAVMFHVNVGLANAIMGLINAARDNVPMLVTSGRTPITETGRLGSRDAPIHWGQEMRDQAGMVRELVKWDYELRTGNQLEGLIDRALAIATSTPQGPVYLSLPREVLAEPLDGFSLASEPALEAPAGPHPDPVAIDRAADLLGAAARPLIIVGRGGRETFEPLTRLAERFAVPVVHFWPSRLAMATDHPLHGGFDVQPWLGEADVVLALDAMVPWLPTRHATAEGVTVIQIGPDPLFAQLPMRTFPAQIAIEANVATALVALERALDGGMGPSGAAIESRRTDLTGRIARRREDARARADEAARSPMTSGWISRCLDRAKGEDAIVFAEAGCDPGVMTFDRPDGYFSHSLSAGLGWGLPAALGAKLAAPDRLVIATIGDGSYMFANPVACHQVAEALNLPVLTIVFDNQGWERVRLSTRGLYPDGHAARANRMPLTSLEPSPAYEQIVRASRGHGERVERAEDLQGALERA